MILPDAKPDDLQAFAEKIYYSGSAAIPDDEDTNEGVSDLYHLLRVGFLMGGIKEEINLSSTHGRYIPIELPYTVHRTHYFHIFDAIGRIAGIKIWLFCSMLRGTVLPSKRNAE